jgi:hypothetical protein
MTEISELPPRERVKRYRELARDAEKSAARAQEGTRDAYRLMAKQWNKLADETDASVK